MNRCLIIWMPSTLLTDGYADKRIDSYLYRSDEEETSINYDNMFNEIDSEYINGTLSDNKE